MTLIAIFFPGLSFLLRGRILKGIVCILLQLLVLSWPIAALWAVIDLQNARADRRMRRLVRAMRHS